MEIYDVVRANGACRLYRPDPVPNEVLAKIFDAARFGPQGGNRQPNRYIVVTDPALRQQLGDLYLARWEPLFEGYYRNAQTGPDGEMSPMIRTADHLGRHF